MTKTSSARVARRRRGRTTLAVTSAWGSKTHTAVAPGATVSTTTTVRASSVEGGTVTVAASGPSGSRTIEAPYAAVTCR